MPIRRGSLSRGRRLLPVVAASILFFCSIDHAAAYSIEMVVRQVGDEIRVESVDPIFRMKTYFEDADKMSFAKNMGMPGSIRDEMRKKVEASLGLEAS